METVPPYRTLLLATDGSDEARRAMAHAFYLARALGAKLYVLYVVDTHRTQALGMHYQEAIHELRKEGKEVIDAAVAQGKDLGIDIEGLVAEGDPGRRITEIAADRQADIVIVGATGKSALQEILVGSVSEYVLRHAKRPVLILRR